MSDMKPQGAPSTNLKFNPNPAMLTEPRRCEVPRRANLTNAEFLTEYVFANQPVIITDALKDWKALKRWTPEFFRDQFGDMEFTLNDEGKITKNTMRSFIDLVLTSTPERPAPYFRNQPFHELFPSLAHDVEPPISYLKRNWLNDHYLLPPVKRVFNDGGTLEIFIGGAGRGFPNLHYDGIGTHVFLMQIYGRKRFVLFPPDQSPFLYRHETQPHVSRVKDLDHPDLSKFPLFAKAVPTVIEVDPGETLFIPCQWWHTAIMKNPSITLSVDLVNSSNWKTLVQDACGNRHPLIAWPLRAYLNLAGARRAKQDGTELGPSLQWPIE